MIAQTLIALAHTLIALAHTLIPLTHLNSTEKMHRLKCHMFLHTTTIELIQLYYNFQTCNNCVLASPIAVNRCKIFILQ